VIAFKTGGLYIDYLGLVYICLGYKPRRLDKTVQIEFFDNLLGQPKTFTASTLRLLRMRELTD
jgi:hypothetical protein